MLKNATILASLGLLTTNNHTLRLLTLRSPLRLLLFSLLLHLRLQLHPAIASKFSILPFLTYFKEAKGITTSRSGKEGMPPNLKQAPHPIRLVGQTLNSGC